MIALLLVIAPPFPTIDSFGGTPFSDPPAAHVRLVNESVKITIHRGKAVAETQYMFKNMSDVAVETSLVLPLNSLNTNVAFTRNRFSSLKATWDKEPVQLEAGPTAADVNSTATTYTKQFVARVTFEPNATHVARFTYTFSLGHEIDHRLIAYSTATGRDWSGEIERADYSFNYSENTVFHVIGFKPGWRWQWGNEGAYYQRRAFEPGRQERYEFHYYPPDR